MPDSPAVRSARGHIEMLEWLIGRHRERLETGTDHVDPETTRRWIAAEEARLADWRKVLEAALREQERARLESL